LDDLSNSGPGVRLSSEGRATTLKTVTGKGEIMPHYLLRAQPDGTVLITDGPYLETKEHVGGFTILKAANLDEALAWARKGALACRVPVEVRPFFRSNIR
jgi:hypothetical protein